MWAFNNSILCQRGSAGVQSEGTVWGSFPTNSACVKINLVLYVLPTDCPVISELSLLVVHSSTCIQEKVWRFVRLGGAGL